MLYYNLFHLYKKKKMGVFKIIKPPLHFLIVMMKMMFLRFTRARKIHENKRNLATWRKPSPAFMELKFVHFFFCSSSSPSRFFLPSRYKIYNTPYKCKNGRIVIDRPVLIICSSSFCFAFYFVWFASVTFFTHKCG